VIYRVRHGQSVWNAPPTGPKDKPPTRADRPWQGAGKSRRSGYRC
jgi:broad specificity phosphatase PhoE